MGLNCGLGEGDWQDVGLLFCAGGQLVSRREETAQEEVVSGTNEVEDRNGYPGSVVDEEGE